MKLIIFICLSSSIFYAKCGLLGGLLGEQLDVSLDEKVVKNVVGTLDKQTKGIVEDLGGLLGPKKNEESKTNKPLEENVKKDDKRQDTTTDTTTIGIATTPVNENVNKQQTMEQEMPKNDMKPSTATEKIKTEEIEESTTEAPISISTFASQLVTTETN